MGLLSIHRKEKTFTAERVFIENWKAAAEIRIYISRIYMDTNRTRRDRASVCPSQEDTSNSSCGVLGQGAAVQSCPAHPGRPDLATGPAGHWAVQVKRVCIMYRLRENVAQGMRNVNAWMPFPGTRLVFVFRGNCRPCRTVARATGGRIFDQSVN